MVKQERNIHCAVCGKTYADPTAAQNVRAPLRVHSFSRGSDFLSQHARKHNGGGQEALAVVSPQPTGAVGAQQTTLPIPTAGNIGTAHPPPSQRTPLNLWFESTPKRRKTVPSI